MYYIVMEEKIRLFPIYEVMAENRDKDATMAARLGANGLQFVLELFLGSG